MIEHGFSVLTPSRPGYDNTPSEVGKSAQAAADALAAHLHDLTVLDVNMVIKRMSPDELAFVKRMLQTSQASKGFLNDIEHKLDHLAAITRPVLVMYSPNDGTVSPRNAQRLANEIATCELYEVLSDTHLI